MAWSWTERLLAVTVPLTFVGTILLTPAGFETRPIPSIHPLGLFVLLLVFVAVALNIAALVALATRRPRWASMLAAFGPFLFLAALLVDQSGRFSDYGPPARITLVEYGQFLLEALILAISVGLYRQARAAVPPGSTGSDPAVPSAN